MNSYHVEQTLPSHDQVDPISIGPRLINRHTLETVSHLVERLPEHYSEGEIRSLSGTKQWQFKLKTQDTTFVSCQSFNSKQEALFDLKTWLLGEGFAAVTESELTGGKGTADLKQALEKARGLGCVHLVVTKDPDNSYVIHGILNGQPYREVVLH
jgi:hypothetical protein